MKKIQKQQALTRLTRVCKTNPENIKYLQKALTKYLKTSAFIAVEVAQESGDPIGKVLSICLDELDQLDDLTLLFAVYEKLPTNSIALREVHWVVAKKMIALAQQTPNDWLLLAETTARYAEALADMGKHELALSFAEQSTCLYQRHMPLPDLNYLKTYVVFARCLMKVGDVQQAIFVQTEIVSLYPQLALPITNENNAYYIDLLTMLSAYHRRLEHHQEAIKWGLEALTIAKKSFPTESLTRSLTELPIKSRYRHVYYRTIKNLAVCYAAIDDLVQAKKLLQQTVKGVTDLKDELEDRYGLEFIDTLEVLASVESRLGQTKKALLYSNQAIIELNELYQSRPYAFLADYSSLLVNMGLVDVANGALQTAKQKMDDVIRLLESLCQQFPLRFCSNLATVMNNRISVLLELHDYQQALDDAKRVLSLYRSFAAQQGSANKTVNSANIAIALNTLANVYMQNGMIIRAQKSIQQSIDIYCQLAANDDFYRADLAITLGTLAAIYEHCDEFSLAFKTANEALAYWHESNQSVRTMYAESYHKVAKVRLSCLIEYTQYTQALSYSNTILEHLQQHEQLGIYLFADTLSLRSYLFSLMGNKKKAITSAEEGIACLRLLPIDVIPAYKIDLADALGDLCFLLAEKDSMQALELIGEAVKLYESLPDTLSADMLANKAIILQNQGSMAQECKQYALSEVSLQKAIGYQQQIIDQHEDYFYDLVTMFQLLINTHIYSGKQANAIDTIQTLKSHLQRVQSTTEITELLQDLKGVERSLSANNCEYV